MEKRASLWSPRKGSPNLSRRRLISTNSNLDVSIIEYEGGDPKVSFKKRLPFEDNDTEVSSSLEQSRVEEESQVQPFFTPPRRRINYSELSSKKDGQSQNSSRILSLDNSLRTVSSSDADDENEKHEISSVQNDTLLPNDYVNKSRYNNLNFETEDMPTSTTSIKFDDSSTSISIIENQSQSINTLSSTSLFNPSIGRFTGEFDFDNRITEGAISSRNVNTFPKLPNSSIDGEEILKRSPDKKSTAPKRSSSENWNKISDLLELAGFDGSLLRSLCFSENSKQDISGKVFSSMQPVMRDFQRQRVIIEKIHEESKHSEEKTLHLEKLLKQKEAELLQIKQKYQKLEGLYAKDKKIKETSVVSLPQQKSSPRAIDLERNSKLWEARAKRFQEDFERLRLEFEKELDLSRQTRELAKQEYEKILGRSAQGSNNDIRLLRILQGIFQEQLRGFQSQLPVLKREESQQVSSSFLSSSLTTSRSPEQLLTFVKRICELVQSNSNIATDDWAETADFVDAHGPLPTRLLSLIIPQISQWINQSREYEHLKSWQDELFFHLNVRTEEGASREIRRLLLEARTRHWSE